jgi:hypothetical protein
MSHGGGCILRRPVGLLTWIIDERLPEPARTWMLQNDPHALDAEIRSAFVEGPIARDLTTWSVPCLIYAGEEDEMHEDPRGQQRPCRAPPSSPFPATRTSQRSTWRISYFRRSLSCSARLDPGIAERLQFP